MKEPRPSDIEHNPGKKLTRTQFAGLTGVIALIAAGSFLPGGESGSVFGNTWRFMTGGDQNPAERVEPQPVGEAVVYRFGGDKDANGTVITTAEQLAREYYRKELKVDPDEIDLRPLQQELRSLAKGEGPTIEAGTGAEFQPLDDGKIRITIADTLGDNGEAPIQGVFDPSSS